MSEDWKNERAEAAMREGTEAIRKAAEEKAKMEIIDEDNDKWTQIKESLYSSINSPEYDTYVILIISKMKKMYHLPVKK
jgi:hypothetical protein